MGNFKIKDMDLYYSDFHAGTVTGSGATILSIEGSKDRPYINAVTFGEIEDLGVTDINNMGAAMAPDDVKIRPYPTNEGMVFFYTQI